MIHNVRQWIRVVLKGCNGPIKKVLVKCIVPARVRSMYNHYSTDVFLISFPKTGRTWLRTMIGRALELHYGLDEGHALNLTKLAAVEPRIPKIQVIHDDDPQLKRPNELNRKKKKYRWAKVIFLVRDPRDVIVSLYFQEKKRLKKEVGTLEEFVFRERGGIKTIVEYYNIWLSNRDVPKGGFLLVCYEDMHKDAVHELRRILDFIGIEGVSQEIVELAAQYAKFDNMRKMEEQGKFDSDKLRPGNPGDPESFKTRKGEVGGYRSYLSVKELRFISDALRGLSLQRYNNSK